MRIFSARCLGVYERGSGVGGPGFAAAESGFPHSPQNFIPGAFSKPQPAHLDFSDAPHSPQNFMPLAFSKAQAGQRIDGPGGHRHRRPLPYGDSRNSAEGVLQCEVALDVNDARNQMRFPGDRERRELIRGGRGARCAVVEAERGKPPLVLEARRCRRAGEAPVATSLRPSSCSSGSRSTSRLS